jgi:ATP-dependent RNA helicase RhlE
MRKNSFNAPAPSRGGKVFRNSRFNKQRSGGKRNGQYIDPARFVNEAVAVAEAPVYEPKHQFNDFDLTQMLKDNVAARNFVQPTPIQDQSIPSVLEGKDVIGLANTGTGKTAAFLLPLINSLILNPNKFTALIMVPTRELAVQIDEEFRAFAKGTRVYSALCVGGVSIHGQKAALRRRPQVIIGTPGRLKDLNQQRALRLDNVGFLVLDEADRMLDMGFIKDIRFLVDQTPKQRQSLCFSATITPEIDRLIGDFLKEPITVSVRSSETSANVNQDVVRTMSKEHKLEVLQDLLKKEDFDKVLIFGQTKFGVQRLADTLSRSGIAAEAIHGNKSQPQRQRALRAFKNNQVKVLVATDVAARGLDIPNVSHVINYDKPNTYDDYVHRIGRTGRAGNSGQALTFI